ncbi:MAG: hypothetical protein ACI9SK_001334 [Zhongshania sp.]|jgi:hypothetical protein
MISSQKMLAYIIFHLDNPMKTAQEIKPSGVILIDG